MTEDIDNGWFGGDQSSSANKVCLGAESILLGLHLFH